MSAGNRRYRTRARRITLWSLTAAIVCAGCSRPPPAGSARTQSDAGPEHTLRKLRELRAARDYRALPALIVPECGHDVVGMLLAVDDFLAANQRLGNWVRDNIGAGMAYSLDVAENLAQYAGDDLGIFNRHVELLDVTAGGDEAQVSYLIESRSSARIARLRRIDRVWRLDPGRRDYARLTAAFRDMARGLEQALAEFESGPLTLQELRDDPERLMDTVEARLRRGVRMLSKAHATSQNTGQ